MQLPSIVLPLAAVAVAPIKAASLPTEALQSINQRNIRTRAELDQMNATIVDDDGPQNVSRSMCLKGTSIMCEFLDEKNCKDAWNVRFPHCFPAFDGAMLMNSCHGFNAEFDCGIYAIPADQAGGYEGCTAKFDYCFHCKDKNKEASKTIPPGYVGYYLADF
ncbi:MAG: hypothetical protein Q9200_002630 [Gallowayella weberi]